MNDLPSVYHRPLLVSQVLKKQAANTCLPSHFSRFSRRKTKSKSAEAIRDACLAPMLWDHPPY